MDIIFQTAQIIYEKIELTLNVPTFHGILKRNPNCGYHRDFLHISTKKI